MSVGLEPSSFGDRREVSDCHLGCMLNGPFGSLQSYTPSLGKLFSGDCPLSLAGGRHAGQGKTVAINVNVLVLVIL